MINQEMLRQTLIYHQKACSNSRCAQTRDQLFQNASCNSLQVWQDGFFAFLPRPAEVGNGSKCFPHLDDSLSFKWCTAQPLELGRVDALGGDAVAARNMLGAWGVSNVIRFPSLKNCDTSKSLQNCCKNWLICTLLRCLKSPKTMKLRSTISLGHQPSEASSGSARGKSIGYYQVIHRHDWSWAVHPGRMAVNFLLAAPRSFPTCLSCSSQAENHDVRHPGFL